MPLSLTTVLILCVDLGTDMIPAISLAYEQPEADIMLRPPRDAEVDRLVTNKLMCFSYLQIGIFQALAGFYTFFVVLNDYGWRIGDIPGSVYDFEAFPTDRKGNKIIDNCPCGGGQKDTGNTLDTDDFVKINDGTLYDPNNELSTEEIAACPDDALGIPWDEVNHSINFYNPKLTLNTALPLENLLQDWPYGYGCPYGSLKPKKECKFIGSYWGKACYKPSVALRTAQTATFISIVVVQWADLLICKTRLLSIADQGMQNRVMLFGYLTEVLLCIGISYLPFMNTAFRTEPVHPAHWFPSMPFSILIFFYDETRKYLMRKERRLAGPDGPMGFVERYTYY
jgi:sodium/potassium-transporting ATPase subunit alpha